MNEHASSVRGYSAGETGLIPSRDCGALILAAFDNRTLLFSEAHQTVYELNDFAAHVWRSLDAGRSAAGIVRKLTDNGLDRDQAERAVEVTVEQRRRFQVATVEPSLSSVSRPIERLTRLSILIADVAVQLHLPKALVPDVKEVFGLLETDLQDADIIVCARVVEDHVNVFSPGQPDWSCRRSHFIPLLKAHLIETVLLHARYEVAFHAAALAWGDGAVLLVGSPGAGKTTLGIALAKAGLNVLADDVVLLDEQGLVTGVALPFTAKASSWPLLSAHWPGIAAHPSHVRPDGQTLCYIPHDRPADPRPRIISLVVLLNRQDHACTRVEELDRTSALSGLVAEGATRDQRLSMSGFTALVEGLREARCCRLIYSDFRDAADALCGMSQ